MLAMLERHEIPTYFSFSCHAMGFVSFYQRWRAGCHSRVPSSRSRTPAQRLLTTVADTQAECMNRFVVTKVDRYTMDCYSYCITFSEGYKMALRDRQCKEA